MGLCLSGVLSVFFRGELRVGAVGWCRVGCCRHGCRGLSGPVGRYAAQVPGTREKVFSETQVARQGGTDSLKL